MSENEHEAPQLTRRQLRELRNTASTPIITGDETAAEAPPEPVPAAPLPREAEPVVIPEPPASEASVDLGSPALTRRQARQQEKIRTASIPIIAPDAVHSLDGDDTGDAPVEATDGAVDEAEHDPAEDDAVGEDDAVAEDDAAWAEPEADGEPDPETGDAADASSDGTTDGSSDGEASPDADDELIDAFPGATGTHPSFTDAEHAGDGAGDDDVEAPSTERHVVSEELGAALLSGSSAPIEPPTSFDQLLSRSAAVTGAFTAPSALILSQTPDGGPLVAPVTATGEVLITGTFSLPDRFGSTGVVPGSADGAEVDAVLVDGELPASSSPTPIAASAAISTIKSAEDVIRPPAPEKGSRLMIFLAITAGVLAAALAGVLIVALATGVFQ